MNHSLAPRDSPITVGILGAGNVLWAYLQALDRLVPRGLAVEGPVCARREEIWPALLARRPGIRLVADPLRVLDSAADVLVIITPPESHAELTRLALEHGKHVLVEKPMAPSRSEAEKLVNLAARRGLHLMAAPFVQLAPTIRVLWGRLRDGEIGKIHTARSLYGNAGSTWANWYHDGSIGPLAEVGIYNLKSLTAFLGPVTEVLAAEETAVTPRSVAGKEIATPGADVSHAVLRHASGALSSIISSHAIQRYRRPGLEFYGTKGTANLLGDDWDPRGFEIWKNQSGCWEEYEPIEGTWLWTDGLSELVMALKQGRPPLTELTHDLHLLDILAAAQRAARENRGIPVSSRFRPLDLRPEAYEVRRDLQHLHDHTRPVDEQ